MSANSHKRKSGASPVLAPSAPSKKSRTTKQAKGKKGKDKQDPIEWPEYFNSVRNEPLVLPQCPDYPGSSVVQGENVTFHIVASSVKHRLHRYSKYVSQSYIISAWNSEQVHE